MSEPDTLGALLRACREARGLDHRAVAEHLGLNVALIRSYEAAFVIPYPKTLERLADLLDTPVLPLIELRNTAVSIQRAQAEERRGSART